MCLNGFISKICFFIQIILKCKYFKNDEYYFCEHLFKNFKNLFLLNYLILQISNLLTKYSIN